MPLVTLLHKLAPFADPALCANSVASATAAPRAASPRGEQSRFWSTGERRATDDMRRTAGDPLSGPMNRPMILVSGPTTRGHSS